VHWARPQPSTVAAWAGRPSHANAYQALLEMIPVGIVPEYRAPFNAPDHDMLNGSGSVDCRFPRHETLLSPQRTARQLKNLTASHFQRTLWEKGLFQNDEIGQVFGLTYSAVSHIVKDVRVRIKKDPKLGSRAKKTNSQFKM